MGLEGSDMTAFSMLLKSKQSSKARGRLHEVECLLSLGDLAAAREAVLNGRRWVQASENTTVMF